MHIQDFEAEVLSAKSKTSNNEISIDDFKRITEILASGNVQYSYPYQMKEFMIKYANLVLEILENKNFININK